MSQIKKIVVVGAGTSGWLTASAIKKNVPNIEVLVVHDSTIPTMGVGETLTFRMPYFMQTVLGLKDEDWMPRCQATYKSGVRWLNWNGPGSVNQSSYMVDFPAHHLLSLGYRPGKYSNFFNASNITDKNTMISDLWIAMFQQGLLGNNVDDMQAALTDQFYFAADHKAIRSITGEWLSDTAIGFSYHYNAEVVSNAVGDLVGRPCGVKEIDCRIVDVVLAASGEIDYLLLANGEHVTGDLFIDCSGFKRLLMSKMENTWVNSDEYSNNSALVKQVVYDNADNPQHKISNNTTFAAMDSGWRFGIPLQNRSGNGYVFNKNISPDIDKLSDELNTVIGSSGDNRLIQWTPGHFSKAIVNNCASVGLSLGFTDPFDANNLTLTISVIEHLVHLLQSPHTDSLPALRSVINGKATHYWHDVDMRAKTALRLSPKKDTEYFQLMAEAANKYHLHDQFITHIDELRNIDRSSRLKIKLWDHWSYTTLAMRYGIKLPEQSYDPELADLALKYFNTRMARNKLVASRAPSIEEFYSTYFNQHNPG